MVLLSQQHLKEAMLPSFDLETHNLGARLHLLLVTKLEKSGADLHNTDDFSKSALGLEKIHAQILFQSIQFNSKYVYSYNCRGLLL